MVDISSAASAAYNYAPNIGPVIRSAAQPASQLSHSVFSAVCSGTSFLGSAAMGVAGSVVSGVLTGVSLTGSAVPYVGGAFLVAAAVKCYVDIYDGTAHLEIFDEAYEFYAANRLGSIEDAQAFGLKCVKEGHSYLETYQEAIRLRTQTMPGQSIRKVVKFAETMADSGDRSLQRYIKAFSYYSKKFPCQPLGKAEAFSEKFAEIEQKPTNLVRKLYKLTGRS